MESASAFLEQWNKLPLIAHIPDTEIRTGIPPLLFTPNPTNRAAHRRHGRFEAERLECGYKREIDARVCSDEQRRHGVKQEVACYDA